MTDIPFHTWNITRTDGTIESVQVYSGQRGYFYPWDFLEVGDSFVVSGNKESIYSIVNHRNTKFPEKHYKSKTIKVGWGHGKAISITRVR